MNSQPTQDVLVVGAGITGLATAYFLRRGGVRVSLVDQGKRAGGVIRSQPKDGFLFEHGPNSFLKLTPQLDNLVTDLGIRDEVEFADDKAKNRYIVRDGRLLPLPLNPISAIGTRLFPLKSKLRVLKEPFVPAAGPDVEESLAEFVVRRLGRDMLDYAINPFVAGVYAGVPEELSVQAGFPKLYQLEQRYGSLIKGAIRGSKERKKQQSTATPGRMFSFKEGMQTLVDALAARLSDSLYTEARVVGILRNQSGFEVTLDSQHRTWTLACRTLVMAIPAYAYESIQCNFDFPVRGSLEQISYPPVAVVFLGFNKRPTDMNLNGFGFLVPEKERRHILGTIWSSSIFSNRAPSDGVALTTFVGGSRWPESAGLSDDRLLDLIAADLSDLMYIKEKPDIVLVKRWPRAIPQYNLGHLSVVRAVEDVEQRTPGLHITGNFRGGISVTDCIEHSRALSERLLAGQPQLRSVSSGG